MRVLANNVPLLFMLLPAFGAVALGAEATVTETNHRLVLENDAVKLVFDAAANYVPIELYYKQGSGQNLIAATDDKRHGSFSFSYGYKSKDGSVRWADENDRRNDKVADPRHTIQRNAGAVTVEFSGRMPHFRFTRRITVPAGGPAVKFCYEVECTAPEQSPLVSEGLVLPRAPLWPKLNKEAVFHDEFIGRDGRKTTGMMVRDAGAPALHPGAPYARAECFFNDQTGEGVICAHVRGECSGVNNLNLCRIHSELKEKLTFLVIPFQGEYEKLYASHIAIIKDPPVIAHGDPASSSAVILARTLEMTLWADHGSRKIFPEEAIPPTAAEGLEVSLEAAKGEFEPFQIVLTPQKDLDDVRVAMAPLTNENGDRLRAENLKCNPIGQLMSCLDEEIPDLLLQKESIACKKGQNNVFWITVKVPLPTPAGTYRGKLTLWSKGEKLGDVPVRLKVWDFPLPQTPHLYNFSYEDTYYFDGEVDLTNDFLARASVRPQTNNWTKEQTEKYANRMKFFTDHRIVEARYGAGDSSINPRWYQKKDGRWDFDIDFTAFDKARDYCYHELHWPRFGYDCGLFPYVDFINQDCFGGKGGKEYGWIMARWEPVLPKKDPKKYAPQFYDLGDDFTPEFKVKFTRYVRTISEHCRAKGICVDENGNGPICFLADEIPPFSSNHPVSRKTLELARLVKQADSKTIVVVNLGEIPDDPEVLTLMDMWSARGTPDKLENVRRMGRRIGDFYNELYFSIRNPAIDPRVQYWSYWKAGFSFIGNWMMSISLDNIRGGRYGRVPDGPYKNYVINWYFPNMNEPYGEPTSTIRFELMRDGMEDYEYLWMLRRAVTRLKAAPGDAADANLLAQGEALLKRAEDVGGEHRSPPEDCRVFRDYLRDPIELLKLRHEIGELLETLPGRTKSE